MGASGGASGSAQDQAFTTLYRAVCLEELKNIREIGRLLPGPHSMGGKWFAEEVEHAARWGELLEGPGSYGIVEVQLPAELAQTLFRIEKLDGIGPARYIEVEELAAAQITGVIETGN